MATAWTVKAGYKQYTRNESKLLNSFIEETC